MDEPPLRMQRTPAPSFMNGKSESDSLMNLLLKSYTMIALWSPWRSLSERWRSVGQISAFLPKTNTGGNLDSRIFADIQM